MNFWGIFLGVLAALTAFEVINGVIAFVFRRRSIKLAEQAMKEQREEMAEKMARGEMPPFPGLDMIFIPNMEQGVPPFPTHSGSPVPEEKRETNIGQYV